MTTYSVFVYATPMSFPLHFALHTWVEISDGATSERFDLWAYPKLHTTAEKQGYVYKNLFPNHVGTTFSPIARADDLTKRQPGHIISSCSGYVHSIAYQLYVAIQSQALDYPLAHHYNMVLGPNCNTYTNWLINLVPNTPLILPFRAWGKNYDLSKIS
jgi:hypothetical protein